MSLAAQAEKMHRVVLRVDREISNTQWERTSASDVVLLAPRDRAEVCEACVGAPDRASRARKKGGLLVCTAPGNGTEPCRGHEKVGDGDTETGGRGRYHLVVRDWPLECASCPSRQCVSPAAPAPEGVISRSGEVDCQRRLSPFRWTTNE